jgi:hypothetical protein
VARFYLFRRFVFQRPIRYYEVYDDPAAPSDPATTAEPARGAGAPAEAGRLTE